MVTEAEISSKIDTLPREVKDNGLISRGDSLSSTVLSLKSLIDAFVYQQMGTEDWKTLNVQFPHKQPIGRQLLFTFKEVNSV